jgi:hypothetical protein
VNLDSIAERLSSSPSVAGQRHDVFSALLQNAAHGAPDGPGGSGNDDATHVQWLLTWSAAISEIDASVHKKLYTM